MTPAAQAVPHLPGKGRGAVVPPDSESPTRALAPVYSRYLAGTAQAFVQGGVHLAPGRRDLHQRAAHALRTAIERDKRSALACFAVPTIGTATRCLGFEREVPEHAGRIRKSADELVPHLLLELAIRGLLADDFELQWPDPPTSLLSISTGIELFIPKGARALTIGARRLACRDDGGGEHELALSPGGMAALPEGPGPGFTATRRYYRLGTTTRLATADRNPLSAFEAHPDKDGNALGLGDRPLEEWESALTFSIDLVREHLPGEHAEMKLLLSEIVPVGFHAERHLSASYREAIGTVYMTLHPNPMTMLEALIHEFQHNKLNVWSYDTGFLNNPFSPLYKSPVRPDPRPLWGILLAVHAFLPVAEIYRRLKKAEHPLIRQSGFDERLRAIDGKNHEGMDMLRQHAEFTSHGRELFEELEALEARHAND